MIFIFFIFLIFSCSTSNKNYFLNKPLNREAIKDTVAILVQKIPNQKKVLKNLETKILVENKAIKNVMKPPNKIKETETILGSILYQVDSIFYLNHFSKVTAKISKTQYIKIDNVINNDFIETSGTSANIKIKTIKTSDIMSMTIVSVDDPKAFEINNLSTDIQTIDSSFTTWQWNIKALKIGSYKLRLIAKINDNDKYKDYIVFNQNIDVQNKPGELIKNKVQNVADWTNKFKDNWYFLIFTILIPIVVWLFKIYKKH